MNVFKLLSVFFICFCFYLFVNNIFFIRIKKVSYSEFMCLLLKKKKIKEIKIYEDQKYLIATLKDNTQLRTEYSSDSFIDKASLDFEKINIIYAREYLINKNIYSIILNIIYIFIFMNIIVRVVSIDGINKTKFWNETKITKEDEKSGFNAIGGNQEAKEDLMEIIDYLKNSKKYKRMGVKPFKGIILHGAPGTGKTLLAKAMAEEAHVPFLSISASNLDDTYVGVGARRIRDLFKAARMYKKAIIYIDEIDSLGSRQNIKDSGRAQTLNELLTQLDGFSKNDSILIVIASTNFLKALDPALIRTGRFDKKVYISSPNLNERLEILNIYANQIKKEELNLEKIAKFTKGCVGSDLAQIIQQASIIAVNNNQELVTQENLNKATEEVLFGKDQKESSCNEKDSKYIAIHESGHALCNFLLKADKIFMITANPRNNGALGFVAFETSNNFSDYTKDYYKKSLIVLMGGRAAEEIIFGNDKITGGAGNDIEKATDIAKKMVCSFGMGKLTGNINCDYKNCSTELKQKIDFDVESLLKESMQEAKSLIINNKNSLEKLAKSLLDSQGKKIYFDEIEKILYKLNV